MALNLLEIFPGYKFLSANTNAKSMRKFYLTLLVISVILVACQREINEIIEENPTCRIVTGLYYGGSGLNDSVTFSYTDNKVTRAESDLSYATYTYSGENIRTRLLYDKMMNELMSVDSVLYDGSNRITRLVTWYYPGALFFDTARFVYDFTYTGNQLSKIFETNTYYPPTGPEADTIINLFNSNAAGNIQSLVMTDVDGNVYDSIWYNYNTHPNYFKMVHPYFFLFDPFFQLHAGFTPHLPYFYSTNNVSNFIYYPGFDYDINYALDSLNKVTGVSMNGDQYMEYKYQCN